MGLLTGLPPELLPDEELLEGELFDELFELLLFVEGVYDLSLLLLYSLLLLDDEVLVDEGVVRILLIKEPVFLLLLLLLLLYDLSDLTHFVWPLFGSTVTKVELL